jgi:cell division protein FtsI (penicillin-binding protein 3)
MTDKQFVYLSRQADDATAQKVSDLKLGGVDLLEESKRFNPSGDLAQGVLGSVNIDNVGRSGLEQQYESTLTGTPGELVLEEDPGGGTIAGGEHRVTPAQPGNDLVLTIDTAMQFETERALSDQIMKMGAKGGMAIVSNPKTGEILAMADMDRPDPKGPPVPSPNNRALTTVFEPGSASKVITMSAALEEGVVPVDARLTVPDHLQVADGMFTDHDPHPTEQMSLTDILANSSNIGTIMLGQKVGKDRIDSYLRKFGFGSKTSLDFPNESAGIMLPLPNWSGTSIATIPIGQGVAVTALQMLQAYNVIANGGVYVDPKLVLGTVGKDGVRHDAPPSASHRVISTQTAAEVRDMMEQVVATGTGTEAAIDGYTVAGKTQAAAERRLHGRRRQLPLRGDVRRLRSRRGSRAVDHRGARRADGNDLRQRCIGADLQPHRVIRPSSLRDPAPGDHLAVERAGADPRLVDVESGQRRDRWCPATCSDHDDAPDDDSSDHGDALRRLTCSCARSCATSRCSTSSVTRMRST